jgi:flavin-dependent dehydrogenase
MDIIKKYNVVIVGGSIAGSNAARSAAESGLKTLLVESAKTPREKPCSGIQFKYFEKLIGKKIPKEKLCSNSLKKLYMEFPDGKSFKVRFNMLNFTRDIFDDWLNSIAIEVGAEFRDGVRCTDFKTTKDGFTIFLRPKHGEIEKVETKYLIVADGLSSSIRKKIRPQDFRGKGEKPPGVTLNYYLKCDTDGKLDPQTLYQFWNLDFSNLMFAWTYKKNDLWVVGAGHSENVKDHCDLLLEHVKKKFDLKGEIVKTEGYASKFRLDEPNHVYLGEGNLLFIGDAAGLVDMHRGVGMDAAALSGHHAARAILLAEKAGGPAINFYERAMRNIVKRIDKNSKNQLFTLKNNDDLLQHLKSGLLKTGIATFFGNLINKILPANKIILLPF